MAWWRRTAGPVADSGVLLLTAGNHRCLIDERRLTIVFLLI